MIPGLTKAKIFRQHPPLAYVQSSVTLKTMKMIKALRPLVLVAFAIGSTATAQTFDNSGNRMLNGSYYFRQVVWAIDSSNTGSLGAAISIYGTVTFDGNGGYSTTAVLFDSGVGTTQPYNVTGTYTISASGYGSISSPANSYLAFLVGTSTNADDTYGLVSKNGIFIGSSTENQLGYNDMLIAAPNTSSTTLATFKGTYAVADLDSPDGNPVDTSEALLAMNPDGAGNLGTVTASGQTPSLGNVRQSIGGVKYLISNGAYNVQFGGKLNGSNLIAGDHYFYISPDGNFVFGGSPTGWDMLVGVRTTSGAPTFGGLYYQAGMYQDESQLTSSDFADLDSYFGSLVANSGVILQHQRDLSAFYGVEDINFGDGYTFNADGTVDDNNTFEHYVYSGDGSIRIGIGLSPYLGISVALQSPSFTPSGVFINPTGIQNAASSALFTSGIAPGELITISGSNLAPDPLKVDATFPTKLNGVQVMINNVAAPIYYTSSTTVSVMVPYETAQTGSPIAAIQVINNSVPSNTVTVFTSLTSPGVFTSPAGGLGYAIAQHAVGYSTVTPTNPAVAGETILVYLTGLGAVSPAVADGSVGPSTTPLSSATNTITATIGGASATQVFAGLAPEEPASIYAMDITIPAGLPAGDTILSISGPDSLSSEALITIGGGTAASEKPAATAKATPRKRPGSRAAAQRKAFPMRQLGRSSLKANQ